MSKPFALLCVLSLVTVFVVGLVALARVAPGVAILFIVLWTWGTVAITRETLRHPPTI